MRTAYENAVETIVEESQKYRDELKKSDMSEKAREDALELHNKNVKSKLTDLRNTYSETLGAIQGDIVDLVPAMVEKAGEEWDKLSWVEKTFKWSGDKEKYMKAEGKRFVDEVIGKGDGSLGHEFERAFDSLGVEGGNWAQDAADEMLDKMFSEVVDGVTYAFDTQIDPELQKSLDKSGDLIDKALEKYSVKDKLQEKGKDAVEGLNEGIDEASETSKNPIETWMNQVVQYVHDSALKFGSPSIKMHEFGVDAVIGFNEGLGEGFETTSPVIDAWFQTIITTIQQFIDNVGLMFVELPLKIQTAFTGLVDWFINSVFIPLKTNFDLFQNDVNLIFNNLALNVQLGWEELVVWFDNTVVQGLLTAFTTLQQDILVIFEDIWVNIQNIWGDVNGWFESNVVMPVTMLFNTLEADLLQLFDDLWLNISMTWEQVSDWFTSNVADPIRNTFDMVLQDITMFFDNAWINIQNLWQNACDWFKSSVTDPLYTMFNQFLLGPGGVEGLWNTLWDSIENGGKTAINGIISIFEKGINGIIRILNKFIDSFNKVASGLADTAGVSFHSIPSISTISIPRLAKGAVIPPNKEFLAVLGDQKSGTNIETPLETMIDAMYQALTQAGVANNNNQDIVVQIDGYEIARATRKQDRIFRQSTGHSMFGY